MKLYVTVENYKLKHKVGNVITDNSGKIYFMNGFVSNSVSELHAYMFGIMRGLSFINNHLNKKESVEIKTLEPELLRSRTMQRAVALNEYLSRQKDKLFFSSYNSQNDNYYFMICKQQMKFIPSHLLKGKTYE